MSVGVLFAATSGTRAVSRCAAKRFDALGVICPISVHLVVTLDSTFFVVEHVDHVGFSIKDHNSIEQVCVARAESHSFCVFRVHVRVVNHRVGGREEHNIGEH